MEKCLLWGHLAPTTEAAPRSCHQVGTEIFFNIFFSKIFSVRPGRARHHDRPPGAPQHAGHLHCREPARISGRLAGTLLGGSEMLLRPAILWCGSLCHKGGFHARKESIIGRPYAIKTQQRPRNAPSWDLWTALSCVFMA